MNFDCVNPCVKCPPSIGHGIGPLDPANPFVNLSSEEADSDEFIGRRYVVGPPPLGSTWYSIGCIGFCISDVSQQDADLCALQQATQCVAVQWPQECLSCPPTENNPHPLEPRTLFRSNAQQCPFECPDGTFSHFTVAAGRFLNFSQAAADQEAYTFACNQVLLNIICLGDLSPARTCASALYNGSIVCSSSRTPVSFEVVGELPSGLLMTTNDTTAFIQGRPSIPGDYTFTMNATDPAGNTTGKSMSLSVFGVQTMALDDAQVGIPYAFMLVSAGTPAGTLVWTIADGTLPDGLTLNSSTGEISGTPTTEETQSFTVQVSDGVLSCQKQLSITVGPGGDCPDWDTDLMWPAPNETFQDGAFGFFTPAAPEANDTATGTVFITGMFNSQGSVNATATLLYNGTGCNCRARVTVVFNQAPGTGLAGDSYVQIIRLLDVSNLMFRDDYAQLAAGVYDTFFALPDTLGATETFFITLQVSGAFPTPEKDLTVSVTFSNI